MDDEAYARQLFEILTPPLPADESVDEYGTGSDRIDRFDGFGTDLRVTSARVVPGQHGTQVELGFVLALPDDLDVPAKGRLLLPLDAEWRVLSGYDDPADYAPAVARRLMGNVHMHVRDHQGAAPLADLPDRDAQWARLVTHLGHEGTVREVAPGRLEFERDDGPRGLLTVLVTADQWEQVLHRYGFGQGLDDYFVDLLGPIQEDEGFLVFWEGELVTSTREKLPPVAGTAFARRLEEVVAAARAKDPDATFGWYAYAPGRADGPPDHRDFTDKSRA